MSRQQLIAVIAVIGMLSTTTVSATGGDGNVLYLSNPVQTNGNGADASAPAPDTEAPGSCAKGHFFDEAASRCTACMQNCEECPYTEHCARCEPGFYRVTTASGLAYCSTIIPVGYLPELTSFYENNIDILGQREPVRGYAFAYSGKAILTGLSELPFEVSDDGPTVDGAKVRVDVLPCKKMCRECPTGYAIDAAGDFECVEVEKCFPVTRNGVVYCSDPAQEFLGKIIVKQEFEEDADEENDTGKKNYKVKKGKKVSDDAATAAAADNGAALTDFRIGSLQAVTNRDKEIKKADKKKKVKDPSPEASQPSLFYRWSVEQARADGAVRDVSFELIKKGRLFERSIKLQKPLTEAPTEYTVKCYVSNGEETILIEQKVIF